ncbi:MAG: cell wall metabolism sensor histidine kinase WalK [Firmicutes bacterium]|jgi:signal transduction histidine kinase|nr:cell wall metabolism sensor histidine kinase WalK [Bacillota bacterium]
MDIDGERKIDLGGIKKRWVRNYILAIVVFIVVIEMIFVFTFKNYNYDLIQQNLDNRAKITANFYENYLDDDKSNIYVLAPKIMKDYNYDKYAELQILDLNGNIISSSSGFQIEKKLNTDDFIEAREGLITSRVGKSIVNSEKVMVIASPIRINNGQILGVLRYITSLESLDNYINSGILLSVVIFALIIVLLFILSLVFARSILNPIKEINDVSNEMAKGQLNLSIKKQYDDEIGQLAETINYMAREIKKGQDLKNEFISSISHELRTPLTSIKGWGETILVDDFEDKKVSRKGLEIIIRESTRLSKMVEELLDFSKLESNRLILNKEETDLNHEIIDIINLFKPRALKEKIDLTYGINGERSNLLLDRNRFRQIIINLLDNGVKFTGEDKKIHLDVTYKKGKVIITVSDNGIGIPEDHLDKIKEKFYKFDNKKSGSGIGLAICDEIIKMHGGSMTINSKLNVGTNIIVELPTI